MRDISTTKKLRQPGMNSTRSGHSRRHSAPAPADFASGLGGEIRQPEDALAEISELELLLGELEQRESTPSPADPDRFPAVRRIRPPRRATGLPCVVCHGTTGSAVYQSHCGTEELAVCDGCGTGSVIRSEKRTTISPPTPPLTAGVCSLGMRTIGRCWHRLSLGIRTALLLQSIPRNSRVLHVSGENGESLPERLLSRHSNRLLRLTAAGRPETREPPNGSAVSSDGRVRCTGLATSAADAAFDSQSFDAAVLWHTLETVSRPDLMLDELRRVIRPAGQLWIITPDLSSLAAQQCGPEWRYLNLKQIRHCFTKASLRRLLHRFEFDGDVIGCHLVSGHSTDDTSSHAAATSRALSDGSTKQRLLDTCMASLLSHSGVMVVRARRRYVQTISDSARRTHPALAGAFA